MRRKIGLIAAAISLALGGAVITASPVSAHHTHSPSSACYSITIAHPSWVPTSYHSHYNSVGHPVYAHCVYYVRTTFAPRDMCKNYLHHTVWDC